MANVSLRKMVLSDGWAVEGGGPMVVDEVTGTPAVTVRPLRVCRFSGSWPTLRTTGLGGGNTVLLLFLLPMAGVAVVAAFFRAVSNCASGFLGLDTTDLQKW